jgi:hypothetical protein
MDTIDVARVLLSLAFLASLISLYQTVSHLWDPHYYFEGHPDGPQHARFHFVREATGDIGAIVVVAIVLAQPASMRTPTLWWILAVTVGKYVSAYWLGYPVLGVGAPNRAARTVHLVITGLAVAGVVLARRAYQ